MAESLKGTSSADPKEKGLLLDEATGKEFLSSWKSMSMIEDDVMNFSFDTVANGKKKAFNFEKLDMDFNLDGDFEKLTSFKVDMPDLDFSCPPKKTTKREEKSEEESSKFYKEKRDCFSFSFDFNELDGFNFDSSLTKQGEKASNNNQDDKGVASDRNKEQGPKLLQTKINGDSIITELPAPESMANSKQTKKGDPGVRNSINDSSHLNPATDASTSPEKRITTNYEETNPKSPLREKAMSRGECTLRTTQKLPLQSASGNYSNRDTLSDINAEVCSLGRKESSGVGHDVNIEMMAVMGTNHENLKTKGSSLLHITGSEKSKCEENDVGNDVPAEIMVETESVHGDLDLKDTPTTGLSGKALQETCGNQDVKNLTSLPLVRSGSELPLENLTLLEEKEAGAICSNLFRKTEETGSQFLQSSSAQQEVFSVGSKRLGPTCLNPANQNRANEIQCRSKLGTNSKSFSQELTKGEPVLLRTETIIRNLSDTREDFNADAVENEAKLVCNSRPKDNQVMKEESVMLRIEQNAGPSEEKTKVVTSTIKSPHNPMVFAVESLNNGKRMPNVSTSTISSMLRANDKPSSSTLQRNINSRTLKQNVQLPGNTVSKIAHSVGRTQRQTPLTPFLKRKTLEESNADLVSLQPLKRLSKSPSEIRNCTESSERVVEEKENCSEMRTKNIVSDQPTYGLEVSQEVNMMELEMPLIMENDDSVEKAEAYTKELEDICNMLRKKHEEAKEILVRAIVNNNNLLMLNHPIFEEKIREVQKFAAQLVSKELLT